MFKKSLLGICSLTFVLGFIQPARGCMCPISTVEGMFAQSEVVFVGKVVKISPVEVANVSLLMREPGTTESLKTPRWEKSASAARSVTLEVSEAFKGVTSKMIDVLTSANDGGSCDVDFDLGQSYLVYAQKRRAELSDEQAKVPKENWTQEILLKFQADKFNERLPSVSTGICSRTEHLRLMKKEIDEVRQLVKNGALNN